MSEKLSGKLGLIEDFIRCLVSPRSSFRSLLEKPNFLRATGLILVIAIVAALASFNYMSKLPLNSLPQQPPPGLLGILGAILALIGVFGTWLIGSALIHVLSSILKGNGAFGSILTLVGYASLPLLIQQLLRLADSFVISPEGVLQFAAFQVSAGSFGGIIANAAINTFTVFRVWSMILIVIATRENYKMSTTKSAIAVVLSFVLIAFVPVFLTLR